MVQPVVDAVGLIMTPHCVRAATVVVVTLDAPAPVTDVAIIDNARTAMISGRRSAAPVVPFMAPSSHPLGLARHRLTTTVSSIEAHLY